MKRGIIIEYALRIAVAFAFIYPPISAWFNPDAWVGYFPGFILSMGINEHWLLHGFGVVEIIIALWILFGRRIFIPSAVAALMLLGIVLFNLAQMDVLFRDISIMLLCIALAVKYYPKREE